MIDVGKTGDVLEREKRDAKRQRRCGDRQLKRESEAQKLGKKAGILVKYKQKEIEQNTDCQNALAAAAVGFHARADVARDAVVKNGHKEQQKQMQRLAPCIEAEADQHQKRVFANARADQI